jgi:hypothetical protein
MSGIVLPVRGVDAAEFTCTSRCHGHKKLHFFVYISTHWSTIKQKIVEGRLKLSLDRH